MISQRSHYALVLAVILAVWVVYALIVMRPRRKPRP